MAGTNGRVEGGNGTATGECHEYTLKGVKTFQGMDGIGLNATLCRDGKPVAFLLDEGCGGTLFFDWKDRTQGRSAEEALFEAFIEVEHAKIPADKKDEFGKTVREVFDGEYWVNGLVDDMENAKRLRRLCRTKTCFQVGDKIGSDEFLTVKGVGSEIRAHVERKYAGQRIRFMNDEYAG